MACRVARQATCHLRSTLRHYSRCTSEGPGAPGAARRPRRVSLRSCPVPSALPGPQARPRIHSRLPQLHRLPAVAARLALHPVRIHEPVLARGDPDGILTAGLPAASRADSQHQNPSPSRHRRRGGASFTAHRLRRFPGCCRMRCYHMLPPPGGVPIKGATRRSTSAAPPPAETPAQAGRVAGRSEPHGIKPFRLPGPRGRSASSPPGRWR